MESKAPDAARTSRAFGYVLASTIALFGLSLLISLWLYSRGVISGRTRSALLSSVPGWSVSSCGHPYSRGFGSRDAEACETSNRLYRNDNTSFITSSSDGSLEVMQWI